MLVAKPEEEFSDSFELTFIFLLTFEGFSADGMYLPVVLAQTHKVLLDMAQSM